MLPIYSIRHRLWTAAAAFLAVASCAQARTWYVSAAGNDDNAGTTRAAALSTIQHAIDTSRHGDTVVVLPGTYTGPGNGNITLKGKAIVLRSEKPDDPECMRNTVIDPQGTGIAVRFVDDEGPGTVFEGFTVFAGDTRQSPIRGTPGQFELSANARPTTRRIAAEGTTKPSTGGTAKARVTSLPTYQFYGAPLGFRCWDGLDPFHQPSSTTDYYGSGDVNLDGEVTLEDATLAGEMAAGHTTPCIRADVDGSGAVTQLDVDMIIGATTGDTLPGWWDMLPDSLARISWLDKMLAIDPTDKEPWQGWWNCDAFAKQLYINLTSYRGDTHGSEFVAGAVANFPCYDAGVPSHALNAVFVGDDPAAFSSWVFIEPQRPDYRVSPGMWNMPFGSNVLLAAWVFLEGAGRKSGNALLEFLVDNDSCTLVAANNGFQFARSALAQPRPAVSATVSDVWNPQIVAMGKGLLLYEKRQDDLRRTANIHSTGVEKSAEAAVSGTVLTDDKYYAHQLDARSDTEGGFRLLWKGRANHRPGLFWGILRPGNAAVTDTERIVGDISDIGANIRGARLLNVNGTWHALWSKRHPWVQELPYKSGIQWSHRSDTGWCAPVNLTPEQGDLAEEQDWVNRDFLRYCFDAVVLSQGTILAAWCDHGSYMAVAGLSSRSALRVLTYDGQWQSTLVDSLAQARGLSLGVGSNDQVHMLYWSGERQSGAFQRHVEGRGPLLHRGYRDGHWAGPDTLDPTGQACCPKVVTSTQGTLYAVWERRVGERVVPVWSKYEANQWQPGQVLPVRDSADAWYPDIASLPNGDVWVAWSSRSPDRFTIETALVEEGKAPTVKDRGSPSLVESLRLVTVGRNRLALAFSVRRTTKCEVVVTSCSGRKVSGIGPASVSPGSHSFVLSTGNLAAGIYFVRTMVANTTTTFRATVLP